MIRFLAAKGGRFECQRSRCHAGAKDTWRDVRRVHVVMRDRHLRVVARRLTMHERSWPQCRRPHQIGAEDVRDARALDAIRGPDLHEQIVRMLHVDERHALPALARLEQLRGAAVRDTLTGGRDGVHPAHATVAGVHQMADRDRFERKHAGERQPATAHLVGSGDHEPVLRLDRREIRERPLLVVVAHEHVRVGVPAPPIVGRGRLRVMVFRRHGRRRLILSRKPDRQKQ